MFGLLKHLQKVLTRGDSTYIYLSTGTEKSLEFDQPQYATCRSLLRSGPAASLRVNIRAVS